MAIVNDKIQDVYNLTPLQEGMLFHSLSDDDSTAYVVQEAYKMGLCYEIEALKEALHLLALRYDVLRTMFVYENLKEPKQIVLKDREIEVNVSDLSNMDEVEQKNNIKTIMSGDVERKFDLKKDSLLRVTVIKLGDNNSIVVWTSHHIILDGWCTSKLHEKFNEYYKRLIKGESKDTLKTEVSEETSKGTLYSDYIKWLKKQDKEKAKEYWENELDGYDNNAELKAMRSPENSEEQVRELLGSLNVDNTNKLKSFTESIEATINTVAETAVGILLQKYNGINDVVFGKVVSGRNAPIIGIEEMVGLFINTIPVRVTTETNTTVEELIKKQQSRGTESTGFDYYSLAEIQNNTAQKSDLIKVLYVYENYSSGKKNDENKEEDNVITEQYGREQTNYAITVMAMELEGKLTYRILYNPNIYCEEEVQIFLDRLIKVCEEIANKPNNRICEIDVLSDDEKDLWNKYNSTSEDIPVESLEGLVRKQCIKTPNNIAVVNDDDKLKYSELWEKAQKVAGFLHAKGYGRGDAIAVSGERSIWTVVNIIGILAAGCEYVPENPDYPEDRNQYIVSNSKCKMVLDSKSYEIENMVECENYCCDSDPEAVAYTIYTSGSTGVPKGVVIKHCAAANTIQDINNKFNIDESSCIIGLSAFSFDLSVYDIFGALSTGAKLVIVNDQKDVDEIQNILNNYKVTFWNSVPAIMSMYLIGGGKGNEYLRSVLLSGDWIPVTLPEQIKTEFSNSNVCSLGGATEGSIWSIYYPIKKVSDKMSSIPYGMPLANQQMYILNEAGMLCPVGAIGEICIGGKGVAEGYANQIEKTAAVFVEHKEYGRIYHTGDIGRMCPDGFIEFMGRLDEQVKIRGFRIELGEIESGIREIEGIQDVAVVVRDDKSGDKAIFAYFVLNDGRDISVSEIRERLSKNLPDYMIPSYMMKVDKIPVTKNGKINKKALPDIEISSGREYIAPRNEIEEMVSEIWSDVLGQDKISVSDSFFEIGGNSIRAMKLINRVNQEMVLSLKLSEFLKSKMTIEDMAITVEESLMDSLSDEEKEYLNK